MSKVKPLIHGLCSINLFEMGKKQKKQRNKNNFAALSMNKHVEVLDFVFYIQSLLLVSLPPRN